MLTENPNRIFRVKNVDPVDPMWGGPSIKIDSPYRAYDDFKLFFAWFFDLKFKERGVDLIECLDSRSAEANLAAFIVGILEMMGC